MDVQIIFNQIGQQIDNCMDLNSLKIVEIAKELDNPELIEYFKYEGNNFFSFEEVYDSIASGGLKITLKDTSEWELHRIDEFKCYTHSCYKDKYEWDKLIFYNSESDLYKCSECGEFLVTHPDILKKYELDKNPNDCLFPKSWNESGIEAWCKKAEIRDKEWSEKNAERIALREAVLRERYELNADCTNCIHMRKGDCEFGLDEYSEEYCEEHEYSEEY